MPFRVVALDGVDLNGPTDVSDQALRIPAGGRYDLAFTMPANPVRLSVEGARQAGLVLAGSADAPEPEALVPTTTFDPTTYGSPQPVPDMTGEFDVSTTIVLDRLPRILNGRPGLAQTVNGGVYPDIPPVMVNEGDLLRMRVVNRSFETHPMHPHGHHVLMLSVNGRAPSGSPLWLDTFDVQPGEVWEVALRADNPGIWMDHCHNLEHATTGMMFHLAYSRVSTPFTHGPAAPTPPSKPPSPHSRNRSQTAEFLLGNLRFVTGFRKRAGGKRRCAASGLAGPDLQTELGVGHLDRNREARLTLVDDRSQDLGGEAVQVGPDRLSRVGEPPTRHHSSIRSLTSRPPFFRPSCTSRTISRSRPASRSRGSAPGPARPCPIRPRRPPSPSVGSR